MEKYYVSGANYGLEVWTMKLFRVNGDEDSTDASGIIELGDGSYANEYRLWELAQGQEAEADGSP